MICFIDMDGVLAEFVQAACDAHHRPNPYTSGVPEAMGQFDIEKIWGISPKAFWEPIVADSDFWFDLRVTPEAKGIVTIAVEVFGQDNCCILTAPTMDDPHCVPGKNWWIKKHFPQFGKNLIFGSAKQFLSGPGRVLIDDRDRNIEEFNKYGGRGIRVPRLWNQEWKAADHTLEIVKERIGDINKARSIQAH